MSKLRPDSILLRLQSHVLHDEPMRGSQIAAARIVLDKTRPSLSAVTPTPHARIDSIEALSTGQLQHLLLSLNGEVSDDSDEPEMASLKGSAGGDAVPEPVVPPQYSATQTESTVSTPSTVVSAMEGELLPPEAEPDSDDYGLEEYSESLPW